LISDHRLLRQQGCYKFHARELMKASHTPVGKIHAERTVPDRSNEASADNNLFPPASPGLKKRYHFHAMKRP
jgi:hypothetical protein